MTNSLQNVYEFSVNLPGSVGQILDSTPLIMPAQIKPYAVAILLHHGYLRTDDLVAAISPRCNTDDLKVGAWDPLSAEYCEGTRLEKLIDQVIAEFQEKDLIIYDSLSDAWILALNDMVEVLGWLVALGGKFPAHLSSQIINCQMSQPPRKPNAET